MKKLLVLLLTLSLAISLFACKSEKPEPVGLDEEPEIADGAVTPEEEKNYDFDYKIASESQDDIYRLTAEEKAKEFLSALCLKNKEVLEFYFAGNSHDEFLKADINAEITGITEGNIPGIDLEVQVLLSVENSTTPLFTNGESEYTLTIGDSGLGCVQYFGRSENKDYAYQGYWGTEYGKPIPKEQLDAHNFANVYMSLISTSVNVAEMSLDELLGGNRVFDSVFHAMIHYFPKGLDVKGEFNYSATTADTFVGAVKTAFGYGDDILNEFRKAFVNKYPADENGISYVDCGHGANYIPKALTSFEEKDGKVTVTYSLYADSIHALEAAEVKFTFERVDGALRLLDVERVNLSDCEVFGYAF